MADEVPPPRAERSQPGPRAELIQGGALRIFRLLGISVFVHWTWLLVAAIEVAKRKGAYSAQFWNVAEYLTLFGLVLLHEFGHALACRSVGGSADRIMLWPLGGVAYVNPPFRPGAWLWSIAAGPLVNFVLLPVAFAAFIVVGFLAGGQETDLTRYVWTVLVINVVLLAFNLLPFYPLDGGQILRALLWFIVGPARSLQAAAVIGLFGAVGIVLLALRLHDAWLTVLAAYAGLRSLAGLASARTLAAMLAAPRHPEWRCARCRAAPPIGNFWACTCRARFDTFAHGAVCPNCARPHEVTYCPFCGQSTPLAAWKVQPGPMPTAPPTSRVDEPATGRPR